MDRTKVTIVNKQKEVKIPTGIRMLCRRACAAVLKGEGIVGNVEIDISFVNDEEILRLNKDFRNIDASTDVLSFPLFDYEGESEEPPVDEMLGMLGDIVLSLEQAAAQATEYGHSFEREVAFLTVHSMLHLLGYDHETGEEDEADMRRRQSEIMDLMGLTVYTEA